MSTRGKKGIPHDDPDDPPRRRANKRRGHGTFANDRPPVAGAFGRSSGRACLHVVRNSDRPTLEGLVQATTAPGTALNTDEWTGYARVSELGRSHATVDHSAREWARDDDGDGVREVHCNTAEGTWTGLRNFLRPFRGVSKWHLAGYVAMFEWANNLKRVTDDFLRLLLRLPRSTEPAS
jgi:transposase-like protein